jgi:streptogrisin C
MGGLQITFTGWSCTTGFIVRDTQTQQLSVLTAGHCLAGSGMSALWSQHGMAIGRASVEAFRSGSNADVGAIDLTESRASNAVYGSTGSDIRSVTGWAPNSSQTVGSQVCVSGGTSGWRCGSIVAADVDATIGGRLIHHTWLTDFPSARGDSGSPVLDADGRAAGIVIATTATQSMYSTVDWIVSELHARPCVNAGCG